MGVVVSGMRPTGPLHLGHYEGVIRNWIELQKSDRCFFFVADLHALTDRTEPEEVWRWSFEMVKDWLALGIDPDRATIFVQSHVSAHVLLATWLGMVTPVSWLARCPTYKDRVSELGAGSENQGLLSYPVLMASDVALYGADRIPVGEDQVVHLELAREIIRKFNSRFPGADLAEPQPLLTRTSRLTGTDGRKMSKSYSNTLEMSAPREEIEKRIRGMKTDEARQRRADPGEPLRCNLYPWHEIYSRDRTAEVQTGCRSAALGCVDCKKILIESVDDHLVGYRERRAALADEAVHALLERGAAAAAAAAAETVKRVRKAIGLVEPFGTSA
jgi:tryptophanyl-tRNA synthetase